MRIVQYVVGWPPDRFPNGIVTAVGVLAPAMRARGCDFRILASDYQKSGSDSDATLVERNYPQSFSARLGRAVDSRLFPRQHAFREPALNIANAILNDPELKTADIFEVEETFGWNTTLRRRLPMPVVLALHGPWFLNGRADTVGDFSAQDRLRIRCEGAALARAEAVSARSQFVLDAVQDYYGLKFPVAAAIPNAAPAIADADIWRPEAADPNEILFVGRFDRHKGADIILNAFARLAAERPALKLTFAGKIDRELVADDLKSYSHEAFLRAAMPADAAARVSFLGPVPLTSLGALRRRAFVTVIASRIETFCYTLAEALAHGSPTVATQVGAIPEIARNDREALLVEPENAGALAQAIGTLLDRRDLAASLGAAGRERVLAEFSPDSVARMTIEFYRRVLDRRSARRQ